MRKPAGLRKRNGIWHINGKRIRGYGALFESTGTGDLAEAERYLAKRVAEIREKIVYGSRDRKLFAEAAARFVEEDQTDTASNNALFLKQAMPFIGHLALEQVHDETLRPFVQWCRDQGNKNKTVNLKLGTIRRVLNLSARRWRDAVSGKTWLETAPLITMLPLTDQRKPYPIDWLEQRRLLEHLPEHLRAAVLFAINTGLREGEVCALRWQWEQFVPEIGASVFVLPPEVVKNDTPRVVVLNQPAAEAVNGQRGRHPSAVFTYRGQPLDSINNTAFQRARAAAGVPCRVHDLRHTFGRRLRAAGVPHETRQDLLGHRNGNITTHYSAAELSELLAAVRLIENEANAPTVLRVGQMSGKA